MENPGKKVVMESYGKVMENSKTSEFHGDLFARKKGHRNQLSKSAIMESHGKVMEFCF